MYLWQLILYLSDEWDAKRCLHETNSNRNIKQNSKLKTMYLCYYVTMYLCNYVTMELQGVPKKGGLVNATVFTLLLI